MLTNYRHDDAFKCKHKWTVRILLYYVHNGIIWWRRKNKISFPKQISYYREILNFSSILCCFADFSFLPPPQEKEKWVCMFIHTKKMTWHLKYNEIILYLFTIVLPHPLSVWTDIKTFCEIKRDKVQLLLSSFQKRILLNFNLLLFTSTFTID